MVSHKSLSDSKSLQVSRTRLSILSDLNNAVVWIVSTHLLISKSSSPCTNLLVTVPRAPSRIGITVTFMFHSFFKKFPSKVEVLILLFTFFQFYSVVNRDSRVYNLASSLFCCLSLGLVVWLRLGDPFVSQNPMSYSQWKDSRLRIYRLLVWSNFNFLHNSKWITLSSLVVSRLIIFLC